MDHRTEQVALDNGVIAEIATIVHDGRGFTAGGSYVDKAGGLIIGYVSQDGSQLTTWDGALICGLRKVSEFKVFGNTIFAYQVEIDERKWHGRGQGPEMLLRLRRGGHVVRR